MRHLSTAADCSGGEKFTSIEDNMVWVISYIDDRFGGRVAGPWDDSNHRIQLEPRGERGYIEMRAVRMEQK